MQQLEKTGKLPARSVDLDSLSADAIRYGRNARSANTDRAYAADLVHYQAWCAAADLVDIPAAPATIGLYLSSLANDGFKAATIKRRKASISVAHKLAGYHLDTRHPAIAEVYRGIVREIGVRQVKKRALTPAELRGVLRRIPPTLTGCRDRALLLCGFWGALRRSELVGVELEHLRMTRQGYVLTIPHSKTDQFAAGEDLPLPSLKRRSAWMDPVLAIDAWVAAAAISTGRIFRSIHVGDLLGDSLSGGSVAMVVKKTVGRVADLDPDLFAGHSLRSGWITAAAEGGADIAFIMRHSRHRSIAVAMGYVQIGQLFNNPALKSIRL